MVCLFKDDGIICKKEFLINTLPNSIWNCSVDYNEYILLLLIIYSFYSFFPRCFILTTTSGRDDFKYYFNIIRCVKYCQELLHLKNVTENKQYYDINVWKSLKYLLSIHFQTNDDELLDSPNGYTNIIPNNIYISLSKQFLINKEELGEKEVEINENIKIVDNSMINEAQNYINQFIEANQFQYSLNSEMTNNIWIVKPAGKSRGRGIFVSNNYEEIDKKTKGKDEWIVQKYIEKPLIILKHKFDFRVWVLVTDWNPLTAYIYDNCYLRFCSGEYDDKHLDDIFMHLSNNCIQKDKVKDFDSSDFEGLMWHISKFKEYIGKLTV